jgi:Fe2+ or Zn2+ uptake regulation protein
MQQLETLFHEHGLRLTTPRRQVFEALKQAHRPLSIRDIIASCHSVNRSSIYRALDAFAALGIIEIIHVGWKLRYELASPFKPHHHHLECTSCGELIAIDTPELEQHIHAIASAHNYTLGSHHVELRGLCATCSDATYVNK